MKSPTLAFVTVLLVGAALTTALSRLSAETAEAPAQIGPDSTLLPSADSEAVTLRILAKAGIAREVIAGRRTLWEAAGLFRELNQLPPAPIDPTGASRDGLDAEAAREVMSYVRAEFARAPGRGAALLARLEGDRKKGPGRTGPMTVSAEELLERARKARR